MDKLGRARDDVLFNKAVDRIQPNMQGHQSTISSFIAKRTGGAPSDVPAEKRHAPETSFLSAATTAVATNASVAAAAAATTMVMGAIAAVSPSKLGAGPTVAAPSATPDMALAQGGALAAP
eukprot:358813-Chlamydomonas_euryale.AAC.4